MRAAWLLGGLVVLLAHPAPAAEPGGLKPGEWRGKAREAFARGDYEAMAKAYEPLADWSLGQCHEAVKEPRFSAMRFDECLDDCLGLGHAYQLAGNWANAVRIYQAVLDVLKAKLNAGPPPAEGRPLAAAVRSNLERDYARLVRLIGVIQRDELKDPQAAAATLAAAADFCPVLKGSVEELEAHFLKRLGEFAASKEIARDRAHDSTFLYPHRALRELALAQELSGQTLAAIETWVKLNLTRPLSRAAGVSRADIVPLLALVKKVPASQAPPRIPMLLTLSPLAPTLDLNLDEPRTFARSCGWSNRGNRGEPGDFWLFALCPPRGQEFATLDFACDIEQADPRSGGQFTCWTPAHAEGTGYVSVASIGWGGRPPGRGVVAQAFDVPPGLEFVYIETGAVPGKFKVHRVTAKATFRPWEDLGARQAVVRPKPDAWVQTECLPPGGILRRDGAVIEAGNALRYPVPGRYTFTYTAPARPETRTCELNLATDGRYGLFINLDSPFRWKLTTLNGFAQHPPARASLARLADGRWLAAYGSRDKRLLLSASADGAAWDKPWQPKTRPLAAPPPPPPPIRCFVSWNRDTTYCGHGKHRATSGWASPVSPVSAVKEARGRCRPCPEACFRCSSYLSRPAAAWPRGLGPPRPLTGIAAGSSCRPSRRTWPRLPCLLALLASAAGGAEEPPPGRCVAPPGLHLRRRGHGAGSAGREGHRGRDLSEPRRHRARALRPRHRRPLRQHPPRL